MYNEFEVPIVFNGCNMHLLRDLLTYERMPEDCYMWLVESLSNYRIDLDDIIKIRITESCQYPHRFYIDYLYFDSDLVMKRQYYIDTEGVHLYSGDIEEGEYVL